MLSVKFWGFVLFISAAFLPLAASGQSNSIQVIDLTHALPTFQPQKNNLTKPDLKKPWLGSKPIPTFEQQAILSISDWKTNQGRFDLGTLRLPEHHGTHLDAPYHFINALFSRESAGVIPSKLKMTHQISVDRLVGKIVLIDISDRVRKELAKNNGKPSPNKSVTDFSDNTPNVVTAADIAAIEDKIEDGVWLVLNLGWSQFFLTGEADWKKSPYVNDWNHPGLSRAAVDKLIEIMEKKKVKIAGIAADNLSVDSGQSSKGDDDKWTNSWRGHVRLLQRQILLVENAANLDALSAAMKKSNGACNLVVGAIKTVRGSGAPIRLMALCDQASS